MGIKSTQYLTRQEAEQMAIRLLSEKLATVCLMDSRALADMLDDITDDPFANYLITANGETDRY